MSQHPSFPTAMTEREVEAVVREVTDEEEAHYRECVLQCLEQRHALSNI